MELKIRNEKVEDVCEIWLEKDGDGILVNSKLNGGEQVELVFERGIKRLPTSPSINIPMED